MKPDTLNDNDRRDWIMNDEGWLPVVSSRVRAMRYMASSTPGPSDAGSLFVQFHNGRVYTVSPMSQETFELMITAPSVGKAYEALVRNKQLTISELKGMTCEKE
mgnify:CR=1 FL=1